MNKNSVPSDHDKSGYDIPRAVSAKLKYYVYMYRHPQTREPIYIGKGRGGRVFAHLHEKSDSDKIGKIREIQKAGLQPELVILAHGMTSEQANLMESMMIDYIGVEKLTNKVRGHGANANVLMTVDHLKSIYASEDAAITDPVMIIRLPKVFRYSMSSAELFEATCGTWKVGANREKVKYVLAVHDGIVQEIYDVDSWQPGGTRVYETRDYSGGVDTTRWEFTGKAVRDEMVRNQYVHKSVAHYFSRGSQNPIRYIWSDSGICEDEILSRAA